VSTIPNDRNPPRSAVQCIAIPSEPSSPRTSAAIIPLGPCHEVEEIKSIPYVPVSHPFVEGLIGTIRREYLDYVLIWNAIDLTRKLEEFRIYYNENGVHQSLGGSTPGERSGEPPPLAAPLPRSVPDANRSVIMNSPPPGNVLLFPRDTDICRGGPVQSRKRLSGPLHHYHREGARRRRASDEFLTIREIVLNY
jgi:hypothetical protein